MSYSNQFKITIKEPSKVDKGEKVRFVTIPNDVWQKASQELSGTAFKVWIYLNANQKDFSCDFSPADIEAKTGVCISSVKNARAELCEKGFLVEGKSNNELEFYCVPQDNRNAEKRIFTIFNEEVYLTYKELEKKYPDKKKLKRIWESASIYEGND